MKASLRLLAITALLGGGCGDDASTTADGSVGRDGAIPGSDSGSPGSDSGSPGWDSGPSGVPACDEPDSAWLFCENFEAGGGDFTTWFAASDYLTANGEDDRGRLDLSSDMPHAGNWAAHMPAAASSGHQGAALNWYACDGEMRTNCRLRSYDRLHFRVFVRFADDHRYVHHFLNIGGSQPDQFWSLGSAGCRPDGVQLMGTTVDHRTDSHESFFYTYFPEMSCDTRCERYADVPSICAHCADIGLTTCDTQPQCCWGNTFAPEPPIAFPVGRWFCFEMMMQANTPGAHDGSMAYWIDGALAHREDAMMWRTDPGLALNRARLQHYITSGDAEGHSNRVWFDDVVVSTEPIGCERF